MTQARDQNESPQRSYCPAVDIYDTEDAVVLVADLPGVSKDNLEVKVEQNVLIISGRSQRAEVAGEERLVEFEPGDFYRAFTVSDEADVEAVSAEFSAGVLVLRVPRRPPAEGRRIEVQVDRRRGGGPWGSGREEVRCYGAHSLET